ncbi:uncharacterized protein LDX57_001904 [Aspergillus melleus]|uniref:uncharacterized protein n=1 Tax=Aspergillus melleus TaxID=138277 RepID=UPI001E8D1856|nr:uncharacterized protein LDX57_001904 [Aspergillus melleus]KAH8424150.1 hypothetical protein LDX57_001904 [Aspergillus melleus]
MKTCDSERKFVLGTLPGLPSCDLHDSAASLFFLDEFVRSFPLFWFFLSLLCLYTWLSLVSFLTQSLDEDGLDVNAMTVKRSFISKDRVEKSIRSAKKAFGGHGHVRAKKMQERMDSPPTDSPLLSPIVSLIVGPDQRLFVAHEDVLCRSPFFAAMLRDHYVENAMNMAIALPEEEPEILSCVLEFLYKGDYLPRLFRSKDTNTWDLKNAHPDSGSSEATIFLSGLPGLVLRDTAVYCAAEKYGLEGLKRLALRKQGLQSGIPIDVILRSARYAYDNTTDEEYRLRAHYLAMIIRTRHIFKSSGTMQVEMELGHPFFFDLFVAMCNHMDDLEMNNSSPKMT